MHKLVRTQEPSELVQARKDGIRDWDDFPTKAKKVVRNELLRFQNCRCAYCERKLRVINPAIDEWNGHIEHFRKKDQQFYPELTFVWANLFYSCKTGATCGRHKDHYIKDVKQKSQFDLLIDPCRENPEDFLGFDTQGRIFVRSGLSDENKKRAEFTIKAFCLDDPALTQERRDCLRQHEWMINYSVEEIKSYLQSIADTPFVTAIYHYFGERVV